MATVTLSPRSTHLFARPSALHGAARVLDFAGVYDSYNMLPGSSTTDLLAVLQDWLAIEDDARLVLRAVPADTPE